MSLSTYTIELPINKENSYQQLYRGRHENNQIYLLHIFPKQCLTKEMYEQIFHRVKQFDFVQEVLDQDDFIIVAYQNSTLWISLEQKLKIEPLKSFYIKLYHQYSKINGMLDFNQDYIFVKDDEVFIIDYGLDQYVQKKHKDLEYTTKTKTFLFGQMLLNLLCGKKLTEKILACTDQNGIDYIINLHTEGLKIPLEVIENLLRMIILDPHQRATFEEVGQWKLFLMKNNMNQKVSASVVDFSNTIVGSHNNSNRQNQTQRTARPQSHDIKELKTPHFQSVKEAINKQRRQAPSQGKICSSSSYTVASQIVQNNLKRKRYPQNGNVISSIQTQQSFYQTGMQQYHLNQDSFSQFPKTSNQFFAKQPENSQLQQQNSQKGFQTQYNTIQQQPQRVEKKQPFILDGSQAPIQIKPMNQQNFQQKPINNQVQESPAPFFANQNQNYFFQQQQAPSQSIQNQQEPKTVPNLDIPQQTQIIKSPPKANLPQEGDKNIKFKSPLMSLGMPPPSDVDDEFQSNFQNETIINRKQINSPQEAMDKQQQGKKQEVFKKPQQDIKQTNQVVNKEVEKVQGEIKRQTSPRPQPITDIEEPQIIKPIKSMAQDQKQNKNGIIENNQMQKQNSDNPASQRGQISNPPPPILAKAASQNPQPPIDDTVKFNEYLSKYNQYISIIQFISITVEDLNQKLVGTQGNIWIVPLCIVFKRAYEIRKTMLEDMLKQKNIFQLPDFMKFKATSQYQDLLQNFTKQNNAMEQEFSLMLENAKKNMGKLDDQQKQKLSQLLNLDITQSMKDQSAKYLYQQLYPRIINQIGKMKAGTSVIKKFTLEEWTKTRLLCLYCLLVMDLESYTTESALFKEQMFQQYKKSQNLEQIELHCDLLEKKIKGLPMFNK